MLCTPGGRILTARNEVGSLSQPDRVSPHKREGVMSERNRDSPQQGAAIEGGEKVMLNKRREAAKRAQSNSLHLCRMCSQWGKVAVLPYRKPEHVNSTGSRIRVSCRKERSQAHLICGHSA